MLARTNHAREGAMQNAMALAQMFGRPANSALYLPQHEAVAADVDSDGDEDSYAIRMMPLTGVDGKSIAFGATEDIEFEPLKWVQVLNFVFVPADVENLVVTNFVIGQDAQFPYKGAIPLAVFAADSVNALIDVPWCGPGVPIALSIRNIATSGTKVLYGAARVRAIIG